MLTSTLTSDKEGLGPIYTVSLMFDYQLYIKYYKWTERSTEQPRCQQTTLQNKYGLLFQGYINISVLTLELVMS